MTSERSATCARPATGGDFGDERTDQYQAQERWLLEVPLDAKDAWGRVVAILVVSLSLSLSLSGCIFPGEGGPSEQSERLGLTQDAQGRQVVVYATCPGELVERLVVEAPSADSISPAFTPIWDIRSAGASITRITIGEVPQGFSEARPLSSTVPAEIGIHVYTSGGGEAQYLSSAGDASQDMVTDWQGHSRSTSEFLSIARAACSG